MSAATHCSHVDRRLPTRVPSTVRCSSPKLVSSVGFRPDLSSSKWAHRTSGGRHVLISASRNNVLFIDTIDELSGQCYQGSAIPILEKTAFVTSRNVFSAYIDTGGAFSTTAAVLSRSSNAGALLDADAQRVILEFSSKRPCHLIEEISLCTLGNGSSVLAVGASNGTVVLFDTRQEGAPFREFVALESQQVVQNGNGRRGKPSRADDAVVSVVGQSDELLWCAGSSGRISLVDLRKPPSLKRNDRGSVVATVNVARCAQSTFVGSLTSVETSPQFHSSHGCSLLFTTSLGSTCNLTIQELAAATVECCFSPPQLSFPDKWLRSEVCGEGDSRGLTAFGRGSTDRTTNTATLVVDHFPEFGDSRRVVQCQEIRHITSSRELPTDHPNFCMFAVGEDDSLQTWKLFP